MNIELTPMTEEERDMGIRKDVKNEITKLLDYATERKTRLLVITMSHLMKTSDDQHVASAIAGDDNFVHDSEDEENKGLWLARHFLQQYGYKVEFVGLPEGDKK